MPLTISRFTGALPSRFKGLLPCISLPFASLNHVTIRQNSVTNSGTLTGIAALTLAARMASPQAGISVRSGRRIEKGQRAKNSVRHWSTRKDPLEAVWDSMLVPLLKERPVLTPTTLLEMLQDKYPGQYPNSFRRTMQRRGREWKLQSGAEQEVMFRQWHQPGLRGLLDFTKLKGVVVTIAGKLLVHMLYNFRLEWSHWS